MCLSRAPRCNPGGSLRARSLTFVTLPAFAPSTSLVLSSRSYRSSSNRPRKGYACRPRLVSGRRIAGRDWPSMNETRSRQAARSAIFLSSPLIDGRPLLLPESFESVQEEIQRELELVLIVATLTHDRLAFMGGRPGYLGDIGILPRHLAEHDRLHFRIDTS